MQYITPFIFRIRNYFLLLLMLYTLNGFAQYPGWQQYINRDDINSMVDDGDQLWIACNEGGILLFNKIDHTVKQFDKYNSELSKTEQPVKSICLLKPGTILFSSNNLYTFNGTSCQIYNESLPSVGTPQIEVYNDTIYCLCGTNLLKLHDNYNEYISIPLYDPCIFQITADGSIWVGSNSNGFGKLTNGTWQIFTESEAGFPIRHPRCIAEDLTGNIWFGTEIDGLLKYDGTQWYSYTSSNSGVIGNHVESMAINNDNVLFFSIGHSDFNPGTLIGGIDDSYGIQQFNGIEFKHFNDSTAGFPCNRFHSMVFDKDRELLYLGGKRLGIYPYLLKCQGGFCSFDGLTSQIYDINNCGIKESEGTVILSDKNQNVWYADGSYHGLSRFNNGIWTNYNPRNSAMPFEHIVCMATAPNGVLWFGAFSLDSNNSCLNSFDGTSFNSYNYHSITLNYPYLHPFRITVSQDGAVWFVTYNTTGNLCLYRFKDGNFTEITLPPDFILPSNYYDILIEHWSLRSTDDGKIWLYIMSNIDGKKAIASYDGTTWEIINDEMTNSLDFSFTTYKNDLYAAGSNGYITGIFKRENNNWTLIKEMTLNYGGRNIEANDDIIVLGYQVYNYDNDSVYHFDPEDSPLQQWWSSSTTIDQSNHVWWTEFGISNLDYNTLPTGVGISQHQENNLTLYPNPVSSGAPFYTNLESGKGALIEIYDMNGRQLFKSPITSSEAIRPPSFNIGVYVVKIVSEKGITTTKLVVNR